MDALFHVTDGDWGTGLHRPLHAFEFDNNNWNIEQAIAALEAAIPAAARGVESVGTSGPNLLFTYTDATTDTVDISAAIAAVAALNFTDAYQGDFAYTALTDFFTAQGALWQVTFPHTSAPTFDPGANDGLGHNYYKKVLSFPANPVIDRPDTTFTFATSDVNTYNRFTNAAGCVVTLLDADYPVDTEITCRVSGDGPVQVVGQTDNVVIEVPFGNSSSASIKGAVFGLKYVGTVGDLRLWDMFGLLATAGAGIAGLHIDEDIFFAPTVTQ